MVSINPDLRSDRYASHRKPTEQLVFDRFLYFFLDGAKKTKAVVLVKTATLSAIMVLPFFVLRWRHALRQRRFFLFTDKYVHLPKSMLFKVIPAITVVFLQPMFKHPGVLLIVLSVLVLIEYYCFTAINTAFRSASGLTRIIIISLYLLVSIAVFYTAFSIRHWETSTWDPTVRTLVIALFMGIVVAKLLMTLIMGVDDLRRLIVWISRKATSTPALTADASREVLPVSEGITRSRFIARSALLVGGLVLGGFVWGTRNKYRYQIKRVRVPIPGLPDAFKGLRIVQISDIHSGSFDDPEAVKHGIDLVMGEKADLILFTGDLVNDRASEVVPYRDIFSRLKAPMGVYSILGNHDYGDYVQWESDEAKKQNLERLKQHHAEMGWKLMMNEHKIFERNGAKIALLGIENWGAKARFPKYGDMSKAYAGLEQQDIPVKILMSHDPSHWDAEVRKSYPDIQLTLSGHTHGMQFGVLLPWMKWSPVKYVYKQWAGLYTEKQQHLYVNVGYGFLGYPGRLGILPEITVLELV